MLSPFHEYLESKSILLASSSPRRKEILQNLGLKFSVRKSAFEEDLDKEEMRDPCHYALQTALHKTRDVVLNIIKNKEALPDIVIGADTVVSLEGEILEKPKDTEDAKVMLRKLNGKTHKVCSGVVLMVAKLQPDNSAPSELTQLCDLHYEVTTFDDVTEVEFDLLSEDVIRCYAETGESLDKAGGFGIQGLGGSLIKAIHGDYFNVMGLPANKLCRSLANHIERRLSGKS